ncbi:hypothetical protein CPBF367_28750 [Xanthomonas arboricola pv. juglandis]|nr:hypothetical protein CPBF367_28750 [Xanthomonas arboricola pv. juglandis]
MLISENPTFGTQTKIVSPRIEIRWNPAPTMVRSNFTSSK